MNILITGANGYIGRALVRRLLSVGATGPGQTPFTRLTLVDLRFDAAELADDARVRCVAGSIADARVRTEALAQPVDLVFHLAGITSRQAEADFELGHSVNLEASIHLFEGLRRQARGARVVYSSSIAVFGAPMPDHIDDDTPLMPALSYGAQKQIGEILLADYSRRNWLDARSLRLPGIVARPLVQGGALSAFNSDLIRALATGQRYTCPVSAQATLWLMSLQRCVDNLLHAAVVPGDAFAAERRAFTLPALHTSVARLVDALAHEFGTGVRDLIRYEPDAQLEAQFGRLPPLTTPCADRLGFRHDGDLSQLIRAVLVDL